MTNRLIGLMLISLDMYTARAVLHEPPRRILAPLPFSPISISDYLFPGEGPADSLTSLADLLDLGALMEGDIQVTTIAVPLTMHSDL
jgi:Odorant response abnormal 4-like